MTVAVDEARAAADVARGGGRPARRPVRYSARVAIQVVRLTAAGETLAQIAVRPGMPSVRGMVRWTQTRASFRRAMQVARARGGLGPIGGARDSFCPETASEIVARVGAGEATVRVCGDAAMPVVSTVYRWMRAHPEFRDAVVMAKEAAGEALAAEGWDLAMAADVQSAHLTDVRLKHLRWYAGKLSPRVFGAMKAVEPPVASSETAETHAPAPGASRTPGRRWPDTVLLKSFWVETRKDGWHRVRARIPDPATGTVIEEPGGEWLPPQRTMRESAALHRHLMGQDMEPGDAEIVIGMGLTPAPPRMGGKG